MGAGAEAGEVDGDEEEEECTSVLMGEMPPDPPDMAGAMSFLPKLSRLLETLLMLMGAALAPEPELEKTKQKVRRSDGSGFQRGCWRGFPVDSCSYDQSSFALTL